MENTSDEIMLAEAHEIFKYLSLDLYNKIPEKIREYVDDYQENSYHFEYDTTKKLSEQNISQQTKNFIGLLHFMFWCEGEEKEELKKILIENEKNYLSLNLENAPEQQNIEGSPTIAQGESYAEFVLKNQEKVIKILQEKEKLENQNGKEETKENLPNNTIVQEALIVRQESIFSKIINKIKGLFKKQ